MKAIKWILKIILVLSILIFALTLYTGYFVKKALTDYNKNVVLNDIAAEVEVYRDQYGIPHVYAENEKDLYTAVGYLMAEDRLWQMDLLRRVTLGRLSEIFGEDFVNTDLLLRSLRYSEKSLQIIENSEKEILEALQAFSDGVNQYIMSHPNKLPVEFKLLGYKPEPWEVYHSLNLIGYMAWDLRSGWSEFIIEEMKKTVDSAHIAELIPDISRYKTFIFPDYKSELSASLGDDYMNSTVKLAELGIEIFNASNNWAVSGYRSVTGKPIMANDMHLALNVPGIWLQMHMVVKNKLNVTGLVLPGQPLVICGHNDSIAWGMTNTYVDNVDFYLEKINPEDSSQYLYRNEWKKFSVQKVEIKDKSGKIHEKEIRFSHRGPVISTFKNIKNDIVTMHWMGDEWSNEMKTIYLLNHADNWDQFRDAVSNFKSISQNIVYADVNGNIGLYCSAGVPVRKRDILCGILPGWTDEYDWKGFVPFRELPNSYNPENGYVSSANNKAAGNDYPYHIGLWSSPPYRIDRIRELLDQKEKLSVEDFKMIQLDEKSKMAEMFLPDMIRFIGGSNSLTAFQTDCLSLLKEWNGTMEKESSAATLFELTYIKLLENIFRDEIGEDLYARLMEVNDISRIAIHMIWQKGNSVWIDDIKTEKTESLSDISVKSFKDAVDSLQKRFGDDVSLWKWGNIHQLRLQHPLSKVKILDGVFKLSRGPYSLGGSFHTIPQFNYPNLKFGEIVHGVSHRHIYSLNNWDDSQTVIPTGISGIPSSKYYCDQTELYINGKYHQDLFSLEGVKDNAKNHMVFKPVN